MKINTPNITLLRRAFTLIELLVVIIIILLLIIISVPAFRSILNTQDENTAEAVLISGVRIARDAARKAGGPGDIAAVFAYEPNGRTSIVICEKIGTLVRDQDAQNRDIEREVFVPVEGSETLQLPEGWMVRGQSLPGMVDAEWYEKPTGGAGSGGNDRYASDRINWVFPETGMFDHSKQEDDGTRQTFMIRFEAGTGRAIPSGGEAAIVVLERASSIERDTIASSQTDDWKRLDRVGSAKRWARRVLNDPSLSDDDRRKLIGDKSGDTALAKSVSMVVLYPERKLADALGVRLNPYTGTVYDVDATQAANGQYRLAYIPDLSGTPTSGKLLDAQRWLEGWKVGTTDNTGTNRAETQISRIYVVPRLAGPLVPATLPSSFTLNN